MNFIKKLCCPKCKNKLRYSGNDLFCEKCRMKYYIIENMFDFSALSNASEVYKFYENNFGGSVLTDIENKRKYINSTLKDERARNLISNIDFKEGLVIDFGTGRGLIAGALKELKPNLCVIGYDISPKACLSALNSNFVDLGICCDINIPLVDKSVDGAILGDLIEHLLDTEHFLNEVHRVLKTGGTLSLSTPNVSFIRNRITMLKGEFPRTECDYSYEIWNAQHIRFFNFHSIKKILSKCGFKDIEVKGVRLLSGQMPFKRILGSISRILPDNLIYEMMVVKAKKARDFVD